MIFFSESALIEPSRLPEWGEWYKGHLAAMTSVPGVLSAQRFAALGPGVPPSLAMYTVTSPAVFQNQTYLRVRGMGPWVGLVDETQHRRNLFDGLAAAPELPESGVLAVADRAAPEDMAGITWLTAAGLDHTTPYRGIGVFPDVATARRATKGKAALYRPVTARYVGKSQSDNPTPRRNEFGQWVGWQIVPDWKSAQRPPLTPMEGRLAIVEPLDAERHAADLFAANAEGDGSNFTYYAYGPFATVEAQRAWIVSLSDDSSRMFHAIIDKASGQAVGVAAYLNITPAVGVIEVGSLNFSPRLQQKPAATEAMYLMMRRVFDELGYRRYEWKCDSWNLPSRAAAARLGFSYEGLFRQAIVIHGRNRDTMYFSITDREWPHIKAAFERWLDADNFDAEGRQKQNLASFR
ncbi:MAG TPA: GNAT family protein [Stellaceae bacterium]|jgi:RimJ/RimL family protein N-acetyltransferase|nr:GNAT family protein [Stellaceae bacterium]